MRRTFLQWLQDKLAAWQYGRVVGTHRSMASIRREFDRKRAR